MSPSRTLVGSVLLMLVALGAWGWSTFPDSGTNGSIETPEPPGDSPDPKGQPEQFVPAAMPSITREAVEQNVSEESPSTTILAQRTDEELRSLLMTRNPHHSGSAEFADWFRHKYENFSDEEMARAFWILFEIKSEESSLVVELMDQVGDYSAWSGDIGEKPPPGLLPPGAKGKPLHYRTLQDMNGGIEHRLYVFTEENAPGVVARHGEAGWVHEQLHASDPCPICAGE